MQLGINSQELNDFVNEQQYEQQQWRHRWVKSKIGGETPVRFRLLFFFLAPYFVVFSSWPFWFHPQFWSNWDPVTPSLEYFMVNLNQSVKLNIVFLLFVSSFHNRWKHFSSFKYTLKIFNELCICKCNNG